MRRYQVGTWCHGEVVERQDVRGKLMEVDCLLVEGKFQLSTVVEIKYFLARGLTVLVIVVVAG